MAKTWLKFECDNCKKENWIKEDPGKLTKERALIYCCECGHVKGHADREDRINNESSWLVCLPFEGFERKLTRGPVGPGEVMTAETRWGTADASGPTQGLSRAAYMEKYGVDPWTDWCSRFPNKKICQNNGEGRSYKDRCQSNEKIGQTTGPVGGAD